MKAAVCWRIRAASWAVLFVTRRMMGLGSQRNDTESFGLSLRLIALRRNAPNRRFTSRSRPRRVSKSTLSIERRRRLTPKAPLRRDFCCDTTPTTTRP